MTLELAIKVTTMLLAVTLGGLLLRRSSAAARHLLQVLGLTAAVALPALAVVLPVWELPLLAPREAVAATPETDPVPNPQRFAQAVAQPLRESLPAGHTKATPPASGADTTPLPVGSRLSRGPTAPAAAAQIDWILWLWGAGAAFVLLRLGAGWWRMNRIALDAAPLASRRVWEMVEECAQRLGIRRFPRVLTSDAVRVPVLWGFAKPTLLLPTETTRWTLDRLRVVLLHELAHLRRRDGLSLLLGRLSVAIWWFHPLAWWVERRARHDCERACDDIVLACGERPSSYAGHLLDIAGRLPRRLPVPALAIAEHGQLGTRVRAILRADARRGLSWRGACAAFVVIGVALVSVSSARLAARTAEPSRRGEQAVVGVNRLPADQAGVAQSARGVDDRVHGWFMLAHDRPDAGEQVYEEAVTLHQQERWDDAAAAFLEAAEAGYREEVSLYNAACGYARMGQTVQAIELIERSLEAGLGDFELISRDADLDPIRRDAEFRQMMERFARTHHVSGGRYEGAVDRYEDLLAQDSTDGRAWYQVGSALLAMRDFDRSIDALERATEQLQSDSDALYNTACAYSLRGDTARALDYLERAVLAGFDSDERFRNDADLSEIRKTPRFDEIERLADALSLDRFRSGWGDWGSAYSARRWEPAVVELSEFVKEHPEIGRGWSNLGWALHHSRRHAEAREAFLKQKELGYRPDLAAYNIGCTYAMEDQSDQALDWLGQALDIGPIPVGQLTHDDDLNSLHDDPRFEQLLERAVEDEEDLHHRWGLRKLFDGWNHGKHEIGRSY